MTALQLDLRFKNTDGIVISGRGHLFPEGYALNGIENISEPHVNRTEAVVDVRHVFKNSKEFEHVREKLKAAIGEQEHKIKRLVEDLKQTCRKYDA